MENQVREHKNRASGWQFPCKSSLEVITWIKPGYIQVFCASALLEGEGGSPGGRQDDRHHGPQHVGQEHRHFLFKWVLYDRSFMRYNQGRIVFTFVRGGRGEG